MANKLIEELIINVKQKGLTTVTNNVKKLQDNMVNAAAGAELLDSSLKPIPESLKQILAEAKQVDQIIGNLGMGAGTDRLEAVLQEIEDSMLELVGSSVKMNETLEQGFKSMSSNSANEIHDLIVQLERLEDTTENVGRRNTLQTQLNEKLAASQERVNRGLGRTNAQGRGQARNFANIARVAGPLPGLYAVIAANVFTLSEAFRVMTEGDQLNRLEKVGTILGAQVGVPIQSIARDMEEATGYTISYEQALRQATSAATYGFGAEQITDMTIAARRASVALGVDMTDALNRIIRGVSKLEIELLDELGITVRLTEAYDTYARSIGKTADSLSGYQKQQAYLNAVLKESEARQSAVDPLTQATGWERLGASLSGATTRGKQWISGFLEPAAAAAANIFSEDNLTKGQKVIEANLETLKKSIEAGDKGSVYSMLTGDAKAQAQYKKLNADMLNLQYQAELMRDTLAATPDNLGKNLIYRQISGIEAAIDAVTAKMRVYNEALESGKTYLNKHSDAQIEAGNEAYKEAASIAKSAEEYTKITSAVKGVAKPYEVLQNNLTSVSEGLANFIAIGGTAEEFYKEIKISKETIDGYTNLQAAMEKVAVATATLGASQAAITWSDAQKGVATETTALKLQQQSINLLTKEIALAKQASATKSEGSILELEAQRNTLISERGFLLQAEARALLDASQSTRELSLLQATYIDQVANASSEYVRQKAITTQQLIFQQEQLDLAVAQNKPLAERAALEMQILQTKQKSTDLDKAELTNKFGKETDALNQGNSTGNAGPISDLTKQVQLAEQQTAIAQAKGAEFHDQYLERLSNELALKVQLQQKELSREATLQNLFMSRIGMQSTIAMNMEEELAYQNQIGASIYESSRAVLDGFDPAMGSMFDGLEKFTYALKNMGNTSEGVWNGVSSGIQAAAGVMSFMSDQAIQDIDKQIEAEKKKDGKSAESKKKIAQLEAKRKNEEMKAKRISIVSSTAAGIMQSFAQLGPWGAVPAAMIAAMGAMQLSSLDSGTVADPSGAGNIGKLELGSRDNVVNLDKGATSGELNYVRGNSGVGGIQDFVPRARGNNMSPNVSYATGEHGIEVVSSDSSRTSVTSAENVDGTSSGRKGIGMALTINALDSQSVIDRAAEIFAAVEAEANSRGYTLER